MLVLSNLSVYSETIYLPRPRAELIAEVPKTEDSLIRILPEEKPSELIQKEKSEAVKLQAEENIFNKNFQKTFETGIVKDVELIGRQAFSFTGFRASNGNAHSLLDGQTADYGFQGHFRDGTSFKFIMAPFKASPIWAAEYTLKKSIGKHHAMTIGQQRTPVGIEGSSSSFGLATGRRSQFANKYANIRAIGSKISGDYTRIEYDLSVFDTGRCGSNVFEGAPEFAGLVSIKPIKDTKKYGKLKVGGSYNVGKRDYSYNVYSAHLIYDHKKFHTLSEYSVANGYNGSNNSCAQSYGYYTTLMYDITPKIQAFCRMDAFNANTALRAQRNNEYTAGMHYYLKGKKARLTLSYIFANGDSTKLDSSKVFTALELLL